MNNEDYVWYCWLCEFFEEKTYGYAENDLWKEHRLELQRKMMEGWSTFKQLSSSSYRYE